MDMDIFGIKFKVGEDEEEERKPNSMQFLIKRKELLDKLGFSEERFTVRKIYYDGKYDNLIIDLETKK